MRGDAPDWPNVDPDQLRTTADCATFEDLDYYLAARASIAHVELMVSHDDHQRAVAAMTPSNYAMYTLKREGVTLVETRFVPPLRLAPASPYIFGRPATKLIR